MTEIKGKAVNQTELADLYGVHRNTVANWIKKGLPVVRSPNKKKGVAYEFDTAEVAQWHANNAVIDAVGDTQKASEEELKRRKLAAETTIAELEAAKRRNEVIYIDDVVRIMTDDVLQAKARLRNVPRRTSSRIVGETDERTIEDVLLSEIDDALEELSNRFIDINSYSDQEVE